MPSVNPMAMEMDMITGGARRGACPRLPASRGSPHEDRYSGKPIASRSRQHCPRPIMPSFLTGLELLCLPCYGNFRQQLVEVLLGYTRLEMPDAIAKP